MNRNYFIRCCSILLLVALLAALAPLASATAGGGNLYITGYTVTDPAGNLIGSVVKGNVVNITVSLKDTSDGSGQGDPAGLDITKLDDSFTGGALTVTKTSAEGSPLRYEVRLTGLRYKGVGQTLRLQVGTAGQPDSYQTMEVTVTEAVVYEAPPLPTPEPPAPPEAAPAPMVLVSRSEISQPLEADQEMVVTVFFKNLGTARLKSPVATFTPSEGFTLMGGSSSFVLEDIQGRKSDSVKIRIKANSTIPTSSLSLGVELKFNYFNNVSTVQGSITDKISIPAQPRESVPQPVVVVTRSPIEKPISPEETVEFSNSFRNAGAAKLVSPVASVTPSDALTIQNETSTFLLPDMEPGATQSITVKVKAAKEITSSSQSVSTELKFSYDNGTTLTQAAVTDRVNLSANTSTPDAATPDAPVPNIVIRQYSFGGSSVAAGSKFPLSFTFENTGTRKIENVVVTVDGGETFTMNGSTNTFYYKSLSSGGSQTQEVPMQVVPAGKSGAQNITVAFKYEYVEKEKRSQASADIRLSVPVYQLDRFQVNEPTMPETATVGEELEVTMAYVNKGKDDIYNVEATVEGEGVETPARTQYLGNIIAGASGNIGFALTPESEGEISLTLKVSYENGDQQIQTREFPVKLRAEAPYIPEEFPEEDTGTTSRSFPWLWVGLGGGAVVLAAAGFLVWKKRGGNKEKDAGWDQWDQEDSGAEDPFDGGGEV